MKSIIVGLILSMCYFSMSNAFGQLPVKPLASQAQLLKSNDKKLAQNKKLVYDMWREFLEAGHMEVAEKYFAESYMQHNPNAATGRKAVVEFFSKFTKPVAIADSIKGQLVSIVAEGDLVVLSFVRELKDPNDATKTYTTTWFDMFRIENGKIAEHWDSAEKMKMN
ncbi:nuclear transport factor 2 family protein [Emticicia sp. SJ17W-69]|uniref:nuclear transport factor 2 family protein n=1 Tax=Emticicia sp. SJ17W-69 TaxID=3421657 RepID=UPI003EBED4F2